jgi:hypothetical protein
MFFEESHGLTKSVFFHDCSVEELDHGLEHCPEWLRVIFALFTVGSDVVE